VVPSGQTQRPASFITKPGEHSCTSSAMVKVWHAKGCVPGRPVVSGAVDMPPSIRATGVSGGTTATQLRPSTDSRMLASGPPSGMTTVTWWTLDSPGPSDNVATQDIGSAVGSGEQPKGGEISVISTPSSLVPPTPIASPMRTGPEKPDVPPLVIVISNVQGLPTWHFLSPVFSTLIGCGRLPPSAHASPNG
jgi:hypothetical protein